MSNNWNSEGRDDFADFVSPIFNKSLTRVDFVNIFSNNFVTILSSKHPVKLKFNIRI